MLSIYKTHYNPLYSKLVNLSRNIFFYKEILLKDDFETRINLIFLHMSLIIVTFKKKKKNDFPQEAFDNIFLNIEYHIRELGYGDVAVNKKMKILTRVFYDIILKIEGKNSTSFKINKKVLYTYLIPQTGNTEEMIDNLAIYFNNFYNFCFELNNNSMLKGQINFTY